MPPGEFLYLLGGMLDLTAPEATEPAEERISRKAREAHQRAVERAIARKRGTGNW